MQTINTDVFNGLKEIMADIMPSLVTVFLEDASKLLLEIQSGIEEQDQEKILKAAHTLKSSAKNMGAEQLADYCLYIEQSIESQGVESVQMTIYNDANSEMNKVKEILTEIC